MIDFIEHLQAFENHKLRAQWLHMGDGAMRVYCRKSMRPGKDGKLAPCFDIANIDILPEHQRRGLFTAFLRAVIARNSMTYIENALHPKLAAFLRRTADKETTDGISSSFFYYNDNPTYKENITLEHEK